MKKLCKTLLLLMATGLGLLAHAQAPTISSFTPTSGPTGTSVVITGTNFDPVAVMNTVYFGSVKAVVSNTSASTTSISASVPVGATYFPITVTVNGLTAYSLTPFLMTNSNMAALNGNAFESKVDFAVGNLNDVALADIDGDGKPDLIAANASTSKLSVLRNVSSSGSIGTGSFSNAVEFTTPTNPNGIAVGDIDGDGKLDVVVSCLTDVVSVFRNTSTSGIINSSTFAARVDLAATSSPRDVAVRDLDADGRPDIVVVSYTGSNDNVTVFKNTSSPGIISPSTFNAKVDFITGAVPMAVAIADFDGDMKPDLATGNYGSSTISILRNISSQGAITGTSFDAKVDYAAGYQPYGIAAGDMDGDGKVDLLTPNYGVSSFSVFRNAGTGPGSLVMVRTDLTAGTNCNNLTLGDLDADGKPDVVMTTGLSGLAVRRNTSSSGSIAFDTQLGFSSANGATAAAIGDLDGDGKADMAISTFSGSSISVLRNKLAVIPTPTITDFSPLSGYLNSTVTINGTNFSAVPSENTVKFNGVDATVVLSTATQITTTVPASATTGLITVNVGNQTATSASNFTVLIDNTSPVLSTNSTSSTVNAGSSLTVTATFSDPETGILSAALYYRPITSSIGATPPSSLSMTRTTGNTFTATIPAADISELGVEYQFLAYNGVGMGSNISQKFRPAIRHTTGLTLSSYPSSAAGTNESNYRMIAIPLVLDNNTANGIFSAALGNYDPTKWRLFLYTGSATSELNGSTTLFPGVGYWFINAKATSLSTGPGTTVDLSSTPEFSIVLNPGWNQIGNPYNFNISWADVVANNPSEAANLGGNSSKVRVYRGTTENTDVLKVMEGGFVKYLGTTTSSIRIPTTKNTSIQGRIATGEPGHVIAEGSSWELPIKLRNGNVDYNLGGVGMHPEAKAGFDFHDDFNAPRFIEYLEMVFPKKYLGMTYTKDVVPPSENYSWQFSVESNLKDPVTIMSWDQSLIAGRNMYLLDVKQHKITAMNADDQYSFDQRVSSDFKIIVGNDEYIRKELIPSMAILQEPYPNPFASEATIEFALPDDVSASGAELAIYNMQGARITSTTLTTPGPGKLQWRPEENSSGLYLVILKAGSQTISRKILKR